MLGGQARRALGFICVLGLMIALAPAIGAADPDRLVRQHQRNLAQGECRDVYPGGFFTSRTSLREQYERKLDAGALSVGSSDLKERLRTGQATVSEYIPLCIESQRRVWQVLRARGLGESALLNLTSMEQEEIARLRVPLDHYRPRPPSSPFGSSLSGRRVQATGLTRKEFYHSLSAASCEVDEWEGDVCRQLYAYWRWNQRPFFQLTDRMAWAWNQSWTVSGDHVMNIWTEYGCNDSNEVCRHFMFSDPFLYDSVLNTGTSVMIDIGWVRTLHNGEMYAMTKWWGEAKVNISKLTDDCPCRDVALNVLQRYYHQRVSLSGGVAFSPTPSISISPGFAYVPSIDALAVYYYRESRED